jgi:nicotinamidase-related amidase
MGSWNGDVVSGQSRWLQVSKKKGNGMEDRIVRTDDALMKREDCVMVIVDVQEKLVPVITGAEETIQNIIKLVKFSKIIHIPIMVTEQQNLGRTVEQVRSETGDIEAITKVTFSCFASEGFQNYLNYLGRKTLILTGIESHICVAQTALDAPHDYTVQVVSDAVASRDPRNRDIALRKAGTDEFRATLPLVK